MWLLTSNDNWPDGTLAIKSIHEKDLEFEINDLGWLEYFSVIEVAKSKKGIVNLQRSYTMHLLEETRKLGVKAADTTMSARQHYTLDSNNGELLHDPNG